MTQKFLFSDWDDCSSVEKELIKKWTRAILDAKAASQALIELSGYDDIDESTAAQYANLPIEDFEIVTSVNNSENIRSLDRLMVEMPRDPGCGKRCRRKCRNDPNPDDCRRRCLHEECDQ
jgi:hypothetical protein